MRPAALKVGRIHVVAPIDLGEARLESARAVREDRGVGEVNVLVAAGPGLGNDDGGVGPEMLTEFR